MKLPDIKSVIKMIPDKAVKMVIVVFETISLYA